MIIEVEKEDKTHSIPNLVGQDKDFALYHNRIKSYSRVLRMEITLYLKIY